MGLMKVMFKPMAVIDGIEYYSVSTVATVVDRSVQTIRLWDNYSNELEERGDPRLIPKPIRIGKMNSRGWTEEQVVEIAEFAKSVGYGDIAEFSRKRWGERGNTISKDCSTKTRQEKQAYRKQVNKKGKIYQQRKKVEELKQIKKGMLKAVRQRAKKMYEEMNINE